MTESPKNLRDDEAVSQEEETRQSRRLWLASILKSAGALGLVSCGTGSLNFQQGSVLRPGLRTSSIDEPDGELEDNSSDAQAGRGFGDDLGLPSGDDTGAGGGPNPSPTPTPEASPTPTPTPPPQDQYSDKCNPLTTRQLDIDEFPNSPAAYSPELRLYGRDASAMLVIGLDSYDHVVAEPIIEQITLLREDGTIVAMHAITEADVKEDGSLRAIVFDHLNLKGALRLNFLFLDANGNYSKIKYVDDWAFETTFDGLPVVDLADLDSVPADFAEAQGIPNLEAIKSQGFNSSDDHIFSGNRRLFTAQDNARYSAAERLTGWVITDLFGSEIADGAYFVDILEHPTFICFKKIGDVWYRTMVKVG